MSEPLAGRCGTCARFVRVTETVDENGEVHRTGECLLNVWPPPLFETNTCDEYVLRGTFNPRERPRSPRRAPAVQSPARERAEAEPTVLILPEEILDMDADEFRAVLRDVIRDELGVRPVDLGARWSGGEVVLRPGKEGTAEKRIPIETLFHKIVMVRDRLRVLEQRINSHPQLSAEEKLQMQQYVTQCYGSLTTFNVLFADKRDVFVGQKGDKED